MHTKTLTEEERITKIKQYKQSGDAALQLEIIESCLLYVVKIANKANRSKCHAHLKDLISEGRMGVMAALERFDPERGISFVTFCHYYIFMKVQKFNKRNYSQISMPLGAIQNMEKLKRYYFEFYQTHHRAPSAAELSKISKFPIKKVALLMDQAREKLNLDEYSWDSAKASISGGKTPLEEIIQSESALDIDVLLAELSEQERKILIKRFGISCKPQTLKEIGAEEGISHEWVRILENRALAKLKKHAKNI